MNLADIKGRIIELFNELMNENYNEEQLSKAILEEQLSSIDNMRFLVSIEQEYDFEFEDDALGIHVFQSLDDIGEYVLTKMNTTNS